MPSSTVLHITKSLVGIAVLCFLSSWRARADDIVRYDILGATLTCAGGGPYCPSIGVTGTYELSSGMIVGPWSFFGHPPDGYIAVGDGSNQTCDPFCNFAGGQGYFSQGINPQDGYADVTIPVPPEPSSLLLTIIGLLGIAAFCSLRRRRLWRSVRG